MVDDTEARLDGTNSRAGRRFGSDILTTPGHIRRRRVSDTVTTVIYDESQDFKHLKV